MFTPGKPQKYARIPLKLANYYLYRCPVYPLPLSATPKNHSHILAFVQICILLIPTCNPSIPVVCIYTTLSSSSSLPLSSILHFACPASTTQGYTADQRGCFMHDTSRPGAGGVYIRLGRCSREIMIIPFLPSLFPSFAF